MMTMRNTVRSGALVVVLLAGAVEPSPPKASGVEGDRPACLPSPPTRVIALAPSTAEILFALGAGDRLVGVSPFANFPPAAAGIPKIGGIRDPDMEAILALKPDLLILRGASPHIERLCRRNGIPVFHDRTTTLASMFDTIDALGNVLGVSNEAAKVHRNLRSELDAIRSAAKKRRRPRVLLTLRSPDRLGPITTVARGSYLHELIELAGGDNVFGDLDVAYPQVSLEEILARQPEIIIEAMPGEPIDKARRRQLTEQWKAIGPIRAVRTGRIHFITESYALIPSPRAALLARKLQETFAQPAFTEPVKP